MTGTGVNRPAARRPMRHSAAFPAALGIALGATACSTRFGAPEPAATQGSDVITLWRILFWTAIALGSLVAGLILWSLVRYRRRAGGEAAAFSENVRLELAYTAVPLLIVAVIFGITVGVQNKVTKLAAEPDLRIEVTGFQWGWRFRYLTEGVVVLGTSIDQPTLVLPLGATARLSLLSPDVVHAFWVPDFVVKKDMIPGEVNRMDVTPTRPGRFDGLCAEFCGLDHARMRFVVEVLEPPQFQAWVAQQREMQQQPGTNREGPQGRQDDPGGQAAPPAHVRVG